MLAYCMLCYFVPICRVSVINQQYVLCGFGKCQHGLQVLKCEMLFSLYQRRNDSMFLWQILWCHTQKLHFGWSITLADVLNNHW